MMKRPLVARLAAGALLALGMASGHAQVAPASEPALAGTIRIWGHGSRSDNYTGKLLAAWEAGFQRLHPGVSLAPTMRGNDSAIGGLYTGVADLALMERSPIAIEFEAYEPIFKYKPFEISVATGSLDVANHANALVLFVHRDNPLAKLTLAQLDAVFGADHRRATANIRTWGELGLKGAWASRRINVYVPEIANDEVQHFAKVVMKGSQKWNGNLRELRGDGGLPLAVLAKDRYGIALSTLRYPSHGTKLLALADTEAGPYFVPDTDSVARRSYPLVRTVSMFINRAPGAAIEPRLKAFLQYVLSADGQADIARDGGYLPLGAELARQESEKLK